MNSDMTKYNCQHFENAYNIGWNTDLSGHEFPHETWNPVFIEKLTQYCEHPINIERNGVHRYIEIDGQTYVKGFGEIRIIDMKKRIRYAAPNVIIDDILNNEYIPPKEFIEAVLSGPAFDSEEYQRFLSAYSEKNYWGETEENCAIIEKAENLFINDFESFKQYVMDNGLMDMVTLQGSFLNYAIKEEKDDEACWLIENGININAFDGLELLTAIEKNNNKIARMLIDRNVATDGREVRINPLIRAIRLSNSFLVEELIKKYRNLIRTYTNEYVRNCTILDFAEHGKNNEIIDIVKRYLN